MFSLTTGDLLTVFMGAVSVMGTLMYVGRKVGSIEEIIKQNSAAMLENSVRLEHLIERVNKMSDDLQMDKRELAKLGVALFGIDGSNGLRSEIRKLSESLRHIEDEWRVHLVSIETRVEILERKT